VRVGPECKKIDKKGCGAGVNLLYYPVKLPDGPVSAVRAGRLLAGAVPAVWKNSDERGEQYAGDPSTALFRFHFFRAQSSFPIQEALPLTTAMPLFLG